MIFLFNVLAHLYQKHRKNRGKADCALKSFNIPDCLACYCHARHSGVLSGEDLIFYFMSETSDMSSVNLKMSEVKLVQDKFLFVYAGQMSGVF